MSQDVATFMAERMPVVPVPGIEEIRLHQAVAGSGVGRNAAGASPYWAYHWGGGLALARFILDQPDVVKGRRVLDLGSGSGLVAIAAAKAGASEVVAIDTDAAAVVAAGVNAALNHVSIDCRCEDLLDGEPPVTELILVGDLFYDPAVAVRLEGFLDRAHLAGVTTLIGDPYRAPLPRQRLLLLAEFAVSETPGRTARAGVFRYGEATLASPGDA